MRRTRPLRALAVAGAALTTSVVGVAPPAGATPAAVAGGALDWGVRASFRTYVTGPVGGGAITPADGASTNPDGTFRFSPASGMLDQDGTAFDASFGGSVRFVAHGGSLDLSIDDIRVSRAGGAGTLVADVTSKSLTDGTSTGYDDVSFATLDYASATTTVDDRGATVADVAASLTADGAAAFAGFYPAGTALDPLDLRLDTSAQEPPPVPPPPPPTPDPPPVDDPAPTPDVVPWGTGETTGPGGQLLRAAPVNDLDPTGTTVRVSGSGYDPARGIYLSVCVDRGPGVAPTPCLGGADTSGASRSATWISDDPPPYAAGLTQPFGPGGSFEAELVVGALARDPDGVVLADCRDPATPCVITTRADHTASGDRSADVKIPVTFAGRSATTPATPASTSLTVDVAPGSVAAGGTLELTVSGLLPGEQALAELAPGGVVLGAATADGSGHVTTSVVVPRTTPPGTYVVMVRGLGSARTGGSGPVTVLADAAVTPMSVPSTGTLPATGTSPTVVLLGTGLVLVGAACSGLSRRRRRRPA